MTQPKSEEKMEGGCLCGAIRYRVEGPPRRTTNCYCLHCRGSSGAPFLTWVEYHPASFSIVSGTPIRYESRAQVTRQFCGACGTQLTYQHAQEPDTIDVTACSLDDVEAVSVEDHVWCDRMPTWLELADDLPRYRRGRDDP